MLFIEHEEMLINIEKYNSIAKEGDEKIELHGLGEEALWLYFDSQKARDRAYNAIKGAIRGRASICELPTNGAEAIGYV
jgi:hypothetical protein